MKSFTFYFSLSLLLTGLFLTINTLPSKAQFTPKNSGTFSLGIRSTYSVFGESGGGGLGMGGQFRVRLSKHINTEWFADYVSTNIKGLGFRKDGHIGWSVMFYPQAEPFSTKLTPYFLAGHCFDYTRVTKTTPYNILLNAPPPAERWISAIQMGLGTHYNITPRFDVSASVQYMIHLGESIHTKIENISGYEDLVIYKENGASLEGHLFTTLSFNYKLINLW